MYSILIVDDERYIRDGIEKMMPWHELKIDHVDTAESGSKALIKIEKHMPDIVLTDIEMKNMDGLTLIHEVNKRNPDVRLIVLSGHNDFQYLQECCRMDVHDYLLKPVELSKLQQAIKKQVDILRQTSKKKIINRINTLAEQLNAEKLLKDFLNYSSGADDVKLLLSKYGYNNQNLQIAMLSLKFKDELNNDLAILSIKNICMEQIDLNQYGLTFFYKDNDLLVLLFKGSEYKQSRDILQQLQWILQNDFDVQIKIYIGSEVDSISKIPKSYKDALHVRNIEKEKYSRQQIIETLIDYQKNMESQISNKDAVLSLLEECLNYINNSGLGLNMKIKTIFQIISGVYYHFLVVNNEKPSQILFDFLNDLKNSDETNIDYISCAFIQKMFGNDENNDTDIIEQTKKYIDNNLDKPLSVSDLANQAFLSIAYFSKQFKKNTGVGCNYYIMCKRMEKAKDLLNKTNLKVSNIANEVGYKDINYFSLAFKKYTGMSPMEYREINEVKN